MISLEELNKKRYIDEAVEALAEHDKMTLMEKLEDCRHPKWERILRGLVKQLTDQTVMY